MRGKPTLVSGNTAAMLGEGGKSWLSSHFEVGVEDNLRMLHHITLLKLYTALCASAILLSMDSVSFVMIRFMVIAQHTMG